MDEFIRSKSSARAVLFVAAVMSGVALLLLPALFAIQLMPGRDSGLFLYIGEGLFHGRVPYRDVWDHKPPIIYYIDAIGLLLGRGSTWGVWVMEWLSLSITACLSFQFFRKSFGGIPALFAMVAWLTGFALVLDWGNHTEDWILPCQFLALLLYQNIADSDDPSYLALSLLGFTGSVAFLLKPNALALWLAMIFVLILRCCSRKKWHALIIRTLLILFGAVLLPATIAYYLYANDALNAAIDQVFRYNFFYTTRSLWSAKLDSMYFNLRIFAPPGLTFIVFGAWFYGIYLYVRRRDALPRRVMDALVVALIALPLETLSASLAGFRFLHYYIVPLPSWSILVAFAAWCLCNPDSLPAFFSRFVALKKPRYILAACGLLMVLWAGRETWRTLYQVDDTLEAVLQYVRAHTASGDYVLVWGREAEINVLAHRPAPTKYIYEMFFFTKGYASEAQAGELLHDLKTHKPILIIDSSPTESTVAPLGRTAGLAAQADGLLSPVVDYIGGSYTKVAVLGSRHWIVYRYDPRLAHQS